MHQLPRAQPVRPHVFTGQVTPVEIVALIGATSTTAAAFGGTGSTPALRVKIAQNVGNSPMMHTVMRPRSGSLIGSMTIASTPTRPGLDWAASWCARVVLLHPFMSWSGAEAPDAPTEEAWRAAYVSSSIFGSPEALAALDDFRQRVFHFAASADSFSSDRSTADERKELEAERAVVLEAYTTLADCVSQDLVRLAPRLS